MVVVTLFLSMLVSFWCVIYSSETPFDSLPNEMVEKIFTFLDVPSLQSVQLVSKRFNESGKGILKLKKGERRFLKKFEEDKQKRIIHGCPLKTYLKLARHRKYEEAVEFLEPLEQESRKSLDNSWNGLMGTRSDALLNCLVYSSALQGYLEIFKNALENNTVSVNYIELVINFVGDYEIIRYVAENYKGAIPEKYWLAASSCCFGDFEAVKYLLDHNLVTMEGFSIDVIFENGYLEVLQVLNERFPIKVEGSHIKIASDEIVDYCLQSGIISIRAAIDSKRFEIFERVLLQGKENITTTHLFQVASLYLNDKIMKDSQISASKDMINFIYENYRDLFMEAFDNSKEEMELETRSIVYNAFNKMDDSKQDKESILIEALSSYGIEKVSPFDFVEAFLFEQLVTPWKFQCWRKFPPFKTFYSAFEMGNRKALWYLAKQFKDELHLVKEHFNGDKKFLNLLKSFESKLK